MGSIASLLAYMLVFCGAVTSVLVLLVIYGNALDTGDNEEIYLN